MIRLTRLNRESFYLNPDLIQEMETTPDTVLTLSSGMRIVVQDTPKRVIDEIIEFKRRILEPQGLLNSVSPESRES
jgi:flagellar protein FlbD